MKHNSYPGPKQGPKTTQKTTKTLDKKELELLRAKVLELVSKSPEKAARILESWVKSPRSRQKTTTKKSL